MSTTIDQRVVEMRFDNRQFEGNVKTSMSTLDKLKEKLNFTGASKGFEAISNSAKRVDLTSLSNSVESIRTRFSALEVVGVTALVNIANSAVNAGKRMASALTIDPILSGLEEYELKMNSVQTIMANTASKGTTMADVTAALDELNTYADQTIYNFAEMTRNIGTFTAAGVDLDKSVTSIKGIANLAAVSGSNAQQASTAMYQLSQALAAGKVQLMDWNSVVNAGMGGEVFQTALKRTAEHFGTNVDAMIKKYGSFRESLTKGGWLTAEVLTETLTQLSGAYSEADLIAQGYSESQAKEIASLAQTALDAATKVKTFTQLFDTMKEAVQSGWAQSWEIMIGDFEEAKESLTNISELVGEYIGKTADMRNNFLKGGLSSSWKQISDEVRAAGIDVEDFQEKLIATGKKHGVVTDEMITKAGSFEKSLKSGWASADIFSETLKGYAGSMAGASQSTEEMNAKLKYFQEVVSKVWYGDYKNGQERIEALTKAGYDYATVQDLVNKTVDGHKLTLEDLNDKQAANLGFTKEQIKVLNDLAAQAEKTGEPLNELIQNLTRPSGRELLMQSLENVIKAALKPMTAFKEAWNDIFFSDPERLYNFAAGLESFTSKLIMSDESAENLKWTFEGLFAVIDLVGTVLSGGASLVINAFADALGLANVGVLEVTGTIGKAIVTFRDFVKENNFIVNALGKFAEISVAAGKAIFDFAKKVYELPAVQNGLKQVAETLQSIGETIEKFFSGKFKSLTEFIDRVKEMDGLTLDNFYKAVQDFKDNVLGSFTGFGDLFSSIPDDLISGLVNGLRNGGTRVIEAITNIGTIILNTLKILLGIHSPSTETQAIGEFTVEGLVLGIKNGIKNVVDIIKELGAACLDALSGIDWGKAFAIAGTVAMVLFAKRMLDIVDALTAPFEGLGHLLNETGDLIGSVKGVVDQAGNAIKAFNFKMKVDAIKNLAVGIAILIGALIALTLVDPDKLWEAVKVMGVVAAIFGGLIALVEGLSILSSKFGAASINFAAISGGIIAMSAALLIMSVSIKLIASIEPDKATQGFIGLATMVVAIGVVLGAMATVSATSNEREISKLGNVLLKMSVALGIMAVVIKLLGGMEWSEMGKASVGLAGFVGIVALLALISSKIKGGNLDDLGSGMLKISGAFLILTVVAKLLAGMEWSEMGKAAVGLAGFLGVVAILALIAKKLGTKEIAGLGKSLLAISAAIGILALVLKLLAGMDISGLVKGELAVAGLALIMLLLVKAVRSVEKDVPKIGVSLLAMSVAIGILAAVCVALSLIDIKGLVKGVAAVTILSALVAGMVAVTKFGQDVKGTFVGIAVAIGVLAAAVAVLSFIDPAKLAAPVAALTILMGAFSLIVKNSKDVNASLGTMIVISIIIGILATALGVLSTLPAENLIASAAALSALLLAVSKSLDILSGIGKVAPNALISAGVMSLVLIALSSSLYIIRDLPVETTLVNAAALSVLLLAVTKSLDVLSGMGKIAPSALISAGVMSLVLIALSASLYIIRDLPVETTLVNATALSVLLLAVSEAILILSKTGTVNPMALVAAGAMTVIVGILAGILYLIKDLPVETTMTNVTALSTLLLALSASMVLLAVAGTMGASALIGVGSMLATIVAVGGLMAGIGALVSYFPQLEEFVSKGIGLLEVIGKGLGSFFGNIVGGFAEGVFASLPNIGTSLSDFMTTLQPFIEGANSLDPAMLEGVKMLAETLLILTGATLLDALTTFITGGASYSELATQLVPFGEAMVAFSMSVSGIDPNVVTNAATAGKALAEMAATVPNSGGVVAFFAGENDLSVFGTQLVSFGTAMKNFAVSVTGIDPNVVTNAATAGKALAEMASTVPNSGGVVAFFTGENDLSTFAAQIVPFGTAMKEYSLAVAGLDANAVVNSATAGQALVELAKTVPNCGGLLEFFTGGNDLGTFGDQIASFGADLKDYATNVEGIKPEVVTASANAAKALVSLSDSLPELGGFFSNDYTIDEFGTQLSKFGTSFKKYHDEIKDINTSKLSSVITQINGLVSLVKGMSGLDTSGVSSFTSAMKKLGDSGVEDFISAFDGATDKVTKAVESMLSAITSAISEKTGTIKSSFAAMIDVIVSEINSRQSDFKTAGENMLDKLIEGMNSRTEPTKTSISTIVSTLVTTIRGKYDDFKTAGAYVVEGFARGINENTYKAEAQARAMASAAETAARNELLVESPSRKFIAIGAFVVAGLVKGLKDNVPKVESTSSQLGQDLLTSFKSSIPAVELSGVGHYVVQNIADGIEQDMTAEEIASQKAQNIVNAFQKEFDKLDADTTTADLEYQLWEALNGGDASDALKANAKLESLMNEYSREVERVRLAKAEYQTTLDTLGASSDETQEAYNKLLQAQIDLAEMVNEINELQAETATSNQEAFQKYSDYINANQEALTKAGLTLEQIQQLASSHSGFDPNAAVNSMTLDVKDAVQSALENVEVAYEENAKSTLGTIVTKSEAVGKDIATAVGDGVTEKTPEVAENVNTMVETSADEIKSNKPLWATGAEVLVDGFIGGIESNISRAAQAAVKMAVAAYQAAMNAIGANEEESSSEGTSSVSGSISHAVSSGVSSGVSQGVESSKGSFSGITGMMMGGLAAGITAISSAIQNGIDTEPTIKPVLDLSDVESGAKKLNTIVSSSIASSASTGVNNSTATKNSTSSETKSGSTYSFTQNNYSPKALSNVEIYRQTKNQFSAFERMTKA